MKAQGVSVLIVLVSSVASLVRGQAGVVEEACEGHLPCTVSRVAIVEQPRGRFDGINRSFVLARILHWISRKVHKNGLPLGRGADFEITDRALTIAKDLTPQVGDVLDVTFPSSSSENSIGPTSQQVPTTGAGGAEIAMFSARRALEERRQSHEGV